jgi:UDPglucose 6-dehydrogenase
MRVCVLGSWHLGSVTAACLAAAGNNVTVWDADPERMTTLALGRAPLVEPGLDALLAAGLANGTLTVEPDLPRAVEGAELVWITVDTPVDETDTVDLTELDQLVGSLAPLLVEGVGVAVSSQVPVGTCDRWLTQLSGPNPDAGRMIHIAYVPENLRLGAAVQRFNRPDMVVIGSNTQLIADQLEQLLSFTGARVLRTNVRTAELVKHAINAYLATSISFANELAAVADHVGADAATVAQAMRLDERIGTRARVAPGLGFAGGTLARDVTTLVRLGRDSGRPAVLAEAVLQVNSAHEHWPLERLQESLQLSGATVCLLGLSYTVGTSTLRRSQAVTLARALSASGAHVQAHDPCADLSELAEPVDIELCNDPFTAAQAADAVVLMTPWPDYLNLDWERMSHAMKGSLVLDGPNALDRAAVHAAGLSVRGPGRSTGAP